MSKRKPSKKEVRDTVRRLEEANPLVPLGEADGFLAGWARFHEVAPEPSEANLLYQFLVSTAIARGLIDAVLEGTIDVAGIDDDGKPTFGINQNGKQRAEIMLAQTRAINQRRKNERKPRD